MFIYVVSLIFILKIFSFSVSAETIDDLSNLKEANFVVKKSGRVFLIHQSEKAERFLNSKQPKKEIESSTNRNSSFQKEIKKVSLRKTKINGIIKSLEQKTFQSAFSRLL